MIFENHHRLKPRVAHQVDVARLRHPQNAFHLFDRLLGQDAAMVGRFDDDFMSTAAADKAKPVAVVRVVLFDRQGRKFVGDDADEPLRSTAARWAHGTDFSWSRLFVAWAERALCFERRDRW